MFWNGDTKNRRYSFEKADRRRGTGIWVIDRFSLCSEWYMGRYTANINDVNDKVGFDGLIHLGDLQDGMLDKKMCRRIATKCISDMRHICEPLYMAIGNHDTNYFKGNTEWLTEASNMVCMEDLWITMYAGKNKMAGTMWIIQKWTAYDIFIFL